MKYWDKREWTEFLILPIYGAFRAVTWELCSLNACGFHSSLVHIYLNMHTKNEINLIWPYGPTKTKIIGRSYRFSEKILQVLRRYSKTIRAVTSEPYSVKASESLDILVLLFLELHTKNESILTWWNDWTIATYWDQSQNGKTAHFEGMER